MSDEKPIVTISDGKLQGTTGLDWQGRCYKSFRGIPYARSPVGKLRFKAPEPADPWPGVRDASIEGSDSYSRHLLTQKLVGSEDCLYLNVYTPKLPIGDSGLKAVMVWIHGGGFINGSGSTEVYGPEFLVSEDVVVVTINYRLGLLGFAQFADPALKVPGNAGFKDQVLALKWVQKNIAKFGGDPDNVTIFGESAGGVSVHLLMLSPMAKGLFHRAIAQSGVALCDFGRGQLTAPLIAEALNMNNSDESTIIKILNELPVEKLFELQEKLPDSLIISEGRSVGPVLELQQDSTAFLTEEPFDLLISGRYNHVPLMVGYTSREGMLIEFAQRAKFGQVKFITDFQDILPRSFKHPRDSEESKRTAEKIKIFYYGNEEPSLENIDRFYLIYTDTYFMISTNEAVRYHAKSSSCPTYYYRMSIDSQLNIFKKITSIKSAGACHGDDIGYLFKNALTPVIQKDSIEEIGLKRFVKLWTIFAKTGDPNPEDRIPLINVTWPRAQGNQLYFLDIGENLTVGINPEVDRVKFWDEIIKTT